MLPTVLEKGVRDMRSAKGFDDLIEAINIFRQHGNPSHPFHCEHDTLYVCGVDPDEFSEEEIKRLDNLGFFVSREYGEPQFRSFRFGSA